MHFFVTGAYSRSLKIHASTLDPGTWYLISVKAMFNGSTYGPTYHEFKTNLPPKDGFCKVIPYDEKINPIIGSVVPNKTDDRGMCLHTVTSLCVEFVFSLFPCDMSNITCLKVGIILQNLQLSKKLMPWSLTIGALV